MIAAATDREIDVEALYRRYAPMVLRRCRSVLKDEGEAADAMQEVFVQVLRRRESLRGDYPSSLLYRMASNTSFNALRSRRRRQGRWMAASDIVDAAAGGEEPEPRVVDKALIDQIFRGEDDTRAIAEARWVEGAPLVETARRAGLSVSGVRKRLRNVQARGLALLSQ